MARKKHYTHQKRTQSGRFTKRHGKGHSHYSRKKPRKRKAKPFGIF